ncbi:MAG TPA: hypothetical protein VIG33_08800 [Pseudobdellovibrionaceae bacterium]|jgi:hypothetical protein
MELTTYFEDFLAEIRPTGDDEEDYQNAHHKLRENLDEDADISKLLVNTFLQGSYRRKTAVRVGASDKSDIDVVVVTKIPEEATPKRVVELFTPFLNKYYRGQWKTNNRSFEITLDNVKLDLVVTAAPTEADEEILKSEWASVASLPPEDKQKDLRLIKNWIAESSTAQFKRDSLWQLMEKAGASEWKTEPLLIPDREMGEWDETHPLAQIEWTWEKNAKCNTHYINVVKALKWWKKIHPSLRKYPKGYPLEHIIGYCLEDGTESVPKGVVNALERVVSEFKTYYDSNTKPELKDHGVPEHDVFHKVSLEDFKNFYVYASEAAKTARAALDSNDKGECIQLWQKLFGNEKFPGSDDTSGGRAGGYTPRTEASDPGKGRFA